MKENELLLKEKEVVDADLNILREKNGIMLVKLSTVEDKVAALKWRNEQLEEDIARTREEARKVKCGGMKMVVLVVIMSVLLVPFISGGANVVTKLMLP